MNICLVRLPSPYLLNERTFPPLGLMAIGTVLKIKGHRVILHDDSIDNLGLNYEGYGFGPTTPEYPYALRVKKRIRRNNPDARIVIGGSFATLNREICLADGFDSVVCGDGEMAAEQAFVGRNAKLFDLEERPLDEYPIIDRSLIDVRNYKYFIDGRLATDVVTTRGCPYHCGFCCKNYKTVRMRTARNVIEEIDRLHSDFGFGAVMFFDDIFILDKKRAEKIADHLMALDMKWRCLVRADLVVKAGVQFVNMMANTGCVEVGMGIESGSNKILSIIGKGEDVETIKRGIRILKDAGIRVKGFFIRGLPGETRETEEETDRFVSEMGLDDAEFNTFKPYRGSPLWTGYSEDFSEMIYKGKETVHRYAGSECAHTGTQ